MNGAGGTRNGAENGPTLPGNQATNVTMTFPARGSYPYEIDCRSGGGTPASLRLDSLVPLTSLALAQTVGGDLTALTGQAETFVVHSYDEFGSAAPQVPFNMTITGANAQVLTGTTDGNGQATVSYVGTHAGSDLAQATASIYGNAAISNQNPVTWIASQNAAPVISSVQSDTILYLPAQGNYSANAYDPVAPAGGTPAVAWTEVSGPGTVMFSNAQQGFTKVTYPVPVVYYLNVTATDTFGTVSHVVGPITVNPPDPLTLSSNWIQSPLNQASVTGLVPITLIDGETLASGTLSYFPASNPAAVTILNANTSGSGTVATLDTTLLANGSWYIYLQATDTYGSSEASIVGVNIVGNYKPGRVTTTVTDLVVPAPGLPIQIQRTYDSLTRAASSDFGNGWSLGVNVQLDVAPTHDVTLTINGQRHTFYFSPYVPGFAFPGIGSAPPTEIPNILGIYVAGYAPEPGFYGTLAVGQSSATAVGTSTGCVLDWLMRYQQGYLCYGDAGTFGPAVYVYTDPSMISGYAQVVKEVRGVGAQRTYTYGSQRISQNQIISGAWTASFYGYGGGGSVRFR